MKEESHRSLGLTKRTIFRWFLYTLMGGVLLFVDPFGLGSVAEEGSQKVLYELSAPLYPDQAQSDIAIVLVTEQSLNALYQRGISRTNEWPLLYQDWALILRAIAAHTPNSIFVDVLFEQERVTDESLPVLLSALDRLPPDLPIHFAGGKPPYKSPLLQELDNKAKLAGTAWEGFGNGIPLVQHGQPIAALSLYRDACSASLNKLRGCSTDAGWTYKTENLSNAMSVMWGSQGTLPLTAQLEGQSLEAFCKNATSSWIDIGRRVLKSALGDLWPSDWSKGGKECLFHQTIAVDELMLVFDRGSEAEKKVLQNALSNKVVLVGTFFEGLPDQVLTPTIGMVPGVALHAMMLDNLMNFGSEYLRVAATDSIFYNLLVWSFIALVLVVWMAHRERHLSNGSLSNSPVTTEVFTGKSATLFLFVSVLLTATAALVIVFGFRLEPANAIGFLGLAELTRRIHSGWELEAFRLVQRPYKAIKSLILKESLEQ